VAQAQELDSRPQSEAPVRKPTVAGPTSLPEWERCDIHRAFFIFDCRVCAGAVFSYAL